MGSTLTINANLASLNAQRRLQESTASLNTPFQRLSSGLRINAPSDDAAGLAIAASLATDARVYNQGVRNLNDALSAFSIAEGAVNQLATIVTRVRELAEQASNGTFGISQRTANNAEANALVNEYNRIVRTTAFNGQNLIDGTISDLNIQNGYGQNGSLVLRIGHDLQRIVGDGTYAAPLSFTTGAAPHDVATLDVNGDGHVDLISTDKSGSTVSVLLGNGDGTFSARTTFATGLFPNSINIADLNGDDRPDLVVSDSASVSVLLGNGDGTFRARTSFATGTFPATTIGDVNGDGRIDVISADNGGTTVSVLLGNGDGAFSARISFQAGISPDAIVTADVNGDGRLDVITADYGSNTLSVLIGNGSGTFLARRSFLTGSGPQSVVSADINGDGQMDLISTGYASNTINVLLGNGDGTFGACVSISVGAGPESVVTADVNGDGRIDLLSTSYGTSTLNVLFGNGDGTFSAQISFATTSNPSLLSTADVNNDGTLDLISTHSGTNTVSLLLGNGHGTPYLPALSLTSKTSALGVLDQMQMALNRITSELGSEGAAESRLQTAARNLQQMRENFDRAASQITDVDVADESSQLVKSHILQQAGMSILAQANQQPSLALTLLRQL